MLTNVPRIRDVEVMARAAARPRRRRSRASARRRCASGAATVTSDEPDPALVGRLRGSVLLLGPLLARRGRRASRRRAATFPARRTIAHAPRRRSSAMGARAARRAGPRARGAGRPAAGARSISTRRRSPAPRPRCSPRPRRAGATEIRHAAMEPHVVELCEFLRAMGVGDRGRGHVDDPRRRRRRGCAAPSTGCDGDYIEAGSWARRRRDHRRRHRGHGARAEDMEVVAAVAEADERRRAMYDDDRFVVEPSPLTRRRPDHDRPVARVSRATWSASSPCSRRRPKAGRWCTTGCTSCACSRSSS